MMPPGGESYSPSLLLLSAHGTSELQQFLLHVGVLLAESQSLHLQLLQVPVVTHTHTHVNKSINNNQSHKRPAPSGWTGRFLPIRPMKLQLQ